MTKDDLLRAVAVLREKSAPPLKDGSYVVQVHPSQEADALELHEKGIITLGRVVDGEWVPYRRHD